MSSSVPSAYLEKQQNYVPRGRNVLHTIFEKYFKDFCNLYEEKYADCYGRFHLARIMDVAEHFLTCGDYLNGVARIRCTNSECGLVGASHLLDHATGGMIIFGHFHVKAFTCVGFCFVASFYDCLAFLRQVVALY